MELFKFVKANLDSIFHFMLHSDVLAAWIMAGPRRLQSGGDSRGLEHASIGMELKHVTKNRSAAGLLQGLLPLGSSLTRIWSTSSHGTSTPELPAASWANVHHDICNATMATATPAPAGQPLLPGQQTLAGCRIPSSQPPTAHAHGGKAAPQRLHQSIRLASAQSACCDEAAATAFIATYCANLKQVPRWPPGLAS